MDAGASRRDAADNLPAGGVVSPEELHAELERILSSRTFAKSHRLQDLLRYTVERITTGRADTLKEYLLAVEVFGRKPSFDPRFDSIVRVQAARLREKLETYYATEGSSDTILILLPKGAYVPVAHRRQLAAPARRSGWPWFWTAGGLLAAAAALWLAVVRLPAPGPRPPVLRRLTSDGGFTGFPAISKDGRWIAFSSDRTGPGRLAIWVTPSQGGVAARQVTDDDANDSEPAFSPDGRHIAFRSDRAGGGVYIVPVSGGQPRLIAPRGRRPQFSPDGLRIVYWERDETWGPGRIYTVPATGGDPAQMAPDFVDAHYPVWSPDGEEILFCGTRNSDQPAEGHDWWVLRVSSGEVKKTGAADALSRAVPPGPRRLAGFSADVLGVPAGWTEGRILFSTRLGDSENLWEFRIGPDRRIASPPRRLTFGAGVEAQPSVSGNRVAFVSGSLEINVWTTPVDADRGHILEPARRITDETGPFALSPSISLDGSKIAFISTRAGSRDVWFRDLVAERALALTATADVEEGYPCMAPDGLNVVYRVIEKGNQALYLVASSGGATRRICDNCGLPTDWSHDGRRLLFEPGSRIPGIGMLDLSSGGTTEIAVHAVYKLRSARFSPDGGWVAFHAETGTYKRRIFVARLQAGTLGGESQWIPVTSGADMDIAPVWSPDGNTLYFLSERDGFRCIWAQRLRPESKTLVDPPFAVQHFHTGARTLLTNFRANPMQIGLSVFARGIVYSLEELRGNIWTMDLE